MSGRASLMRAYLRSQFGLGPLGLLLALPLGLVAMGALLTALRLAWTGEAILLLPAVLLVALAVACLGGVRDLQDVVARLAR